MWLVDFEFIKGLVFGLEYGEIEEEDLFYICIHIGLIRIILTQINEQEPCPNPS